MKAAITTRYGAPDVLQISEVPTPTPADNEILIRIHATTVTSGDVRMRGLKVPPSMKPMFLLMAGITKPRNPVLGSELAGEVVAVGNKVTQFQVGDHVFVMTGMGGGGYAEYRVLPETGAVAIMPPNASFQEAAAIPFGGTTALHFLRSANIQRGQSVLVYGASGCVGVNTVQLARYFGATVTGVCSTRNVELVQSLGADMVIDYTQEDFTRSGARYDLIMDTVGKTTFAQCEGSLAANGRYVQVNGGLLDLMRPMWNKRFVSGTAGEKAEDLRFLSERVKAGELKAVIDRVYPLEQIADAHTYVDTGRKRGSVVIDVIGAATAPPLPAADPAPVHAPLPTP